MFLFTVCLQDPLSVIMGLSETMLIFWLIVLASPGAKCQNNQRSIEVNPNHVDGEHLEFKVNNGQVEQFVTICFRALFKHIFRPEMIGQSNTIR